MFQISKKNILKRSALVFNDKSWKWVNYLVMLLSLYLLLIFFHGLTFLISNRFSPFNFWMQAGLFGVVWSIVYWANPSDYIKKSGSWLSTLAIHKNLKQDIQNRQYQVLQGKIIGVLPYDKKFYLQKMTIEDAKGQHIEFCLDARLIFQSHLLTTQNIQLAFSKQCIGTQVEICYLPQSLMIIQIFAIKSLAESIKWSKQLSRLIQPSAKHEEIDFIPSHLHYALLSATKITISPESNQDKKFTLVIKSRHQNPVSLNSDLTHFDLLWDCLQLAYQFLPSYGRIQQQLLKEQTPITVYELKCKQKEKRILAIILGVILIGCAVYSFNLLIMMIIPTLLTYALYTLLYRPKVFSPNLEILKTEE